jgi:hypothetical protein
MMERQGTLELVSRMSQKGTPADLEPDLVLVRRLRGRKSLIEVIDILFTPHYASTIDALLWINPGPE